MARTIAGERPQRSAGGALLNAVSWILCLAAFTGLLLYVAPDVLVGYGIVSPETMTAWLHLEKPSATNAQGTPLPTAQTTRTAPFGGGGGGGGGGTTGGSLPPCSTVADTRTACIQDGQGQAAPQEQPTAAPPATPTPPYLAACETAPGERPCWLPADQEWHPVEEVPETPLVLLPPTAAPPLVFVTGANTACADWHPPQPWPEECDQ